MLSSFIPANSAPGQVIQFFELLDLFEGARLQSVCENSVAPAGLDYLPHFTQG